MNPPLSRFDWRWSGR